MICDRCHAEALMIVEFADAGVPADRRADLVERVAEGLRRAYADALRKFATTLQPGSFLDGDPEGTLWKFGAQLLGIVERGACSMADAIASINPSPWPPDGTGSPLRAAGSTSP